MGILPVGGFAAVPDAPVLTITQLAVEPRVPRSFGYPTAAFAGCSIGGYVLLELWRQAPERVLGLAFFCSKPQPDAEANLSRRAATIAQAREGKSAALFDGMAQTLIGATAQERHPEMIGQIRSPMTLTPEALVAVQAGLATRPTPCPPSRRSRFPS